MPKLSTPARSIATGNPGAPAPELTQAAAITDAVDALTDQLDATTTVLDGALTMAYRLVSARVGGVA